MRAAIRERSPGVFQLDDRRLATRNLAPGRAVYGEPLLHIGGNEFRAWNPARSKLAAMIAKGVRTFPFHEKTRVLYLGAAHGTTASHVSDVCSSGVVYCVEFSPRSFRDLLAVCQHRPNMIPILADAGRPDKYAFLVDGVDTIYMDVAQRNQAEILLRNVRAFRPEHAILMIKARSVDVARNPKEVYTEVSAQLGKEVRVLELVDLAPFEEDHAACVVGRP